MCPKELEAATKYDITGGCTLTHGVKKGIYDLTNSATNMMWTDLGLENNGKCKEAKNEKFIHYITYSEVVYVTNRS